MAGRSRGNAKAGGAPPRLQPVDLRPEHTTPAAVARYAAAFAAGTPFPHLVVRDVLPDSLLRAVRDEVLAGPRFAKRNDLYDFSQSESLRLAGGPASAALCSTLYSPAFRAWISSVTGVETTAQMDLSAAVYGPGSYLLCHDDDLAARRIAFILYLVPEDWDAARDGGTLDLFDSVPGAAVETAAVPRAVARRLAPAWNALAFFAVSHLSHHQVAEVLSRAGRAGPRVSVSGWFYGPPLARPPPPPPPPVRFIEPRLPPAEAEAAAAASAKGLSNPALDDGSDDPLTAWVSPAYLRRGAMAAVAAQFARDASVQVRRGRGEEVNRVAVIAHRPPALTSRS